MAHAAHVATTTGAIQGRVSNASTGEHLENARITAVGDKLETFSGPGGEYRLSEVPAGNVQLRVFYTGLPPVTVNVSVAAAGTVQHDFELSGGTADTGVVKMSGFVVSTSKEMSGAALAINEQRFAPNTKNVLATDEFGDIPDGNTAEFLKFMPGVAIDYSGGNARNVSINGVPSDYVPITVDGFGLASVITGTARSVALDFVSINNVARLEVAYSPTPESQGSALAGSVNMVPRSAFDRMRPEFMVGTHLTMRDNRRDLHKSPGPKNEYTRKVHPGFDFSYVVPVSKRFGFTVSAAITTNYTDENFSRLSWRGSGLATNGAAFPHTTPDRPYLSTYEVQDGSKVQSRNSAGATIDYRLTANDRVSLSFQTSTFHSYWVFRVLAFNVNRVLPGYFTPTSTFGAAGAGDLVLSNTGQDRFNRTYMPTLVWRHDGRLWRSEAGLGLSRATNFDRNIDKGFFTATTVRRTGVTLAFDDITYFRPGTISATDGPSGAAIDPYNLGNFAITSATANRIDSSDQIRTAYANVRRELHWRLPVTLKSGIDVRESTRDLRGGGTPYNFVGADGRPSTTPVGSDDQALPFLDSINSKRIAPYGFPRIQRLSNFLLWDYAQTNPRALTVNNDTAYRNGVSNSKRAEELISSAYLRGDLHLFDRRLKLVGGLRAEQTNVTAEGPLSDPTRNFQHAANGAIITGPTGRPLPIATDALAVSELTFIDRGTRVEKEYLRLFPSLNASFDITDKLIARASYYESVGRPNFNQYAGGIALPDTEGAPAQNNRITVNNAGIKAWSAHSLSARLEYYFEGVGQVSIGAFRRDIAHFFGNTVFTPTAEFLALYGVDYATYGAYDVATQHNVQGTVRMTGLTFDYKQALTFLPHFARGLQVFANASVQRATGDETANFSGFKPKVLNWGISLTRGRYNLRGNWNYRGRQRQAEVAPGNSIEPGTFNWAASQLYLDVSAEYAVHRHLSVFANLRNLNDVSSDVEIVGPSTPPLARLRSTTEWGALWTFGVKGRF